MLTGHHNMVPPRYGRGLAVPGRRWGERMRLLGGRAPRPGGRSAQPLPVPEVLSVLACDELGLTAFVAACDEPVEPPEVLVEAAEPVLLEPVNEP